MNMSQKLPPLLCLLTILFFSFSAKAQDIAINEVMSSNNAALEDEDGDVEDWIELYNFGTAEVNLEGFGITDDPTVPYKWVFPNTVMPPNSYLIIFASNKDRAIAGQPLHTNFKISSGGETIVLTNVGGTLVNEAPAVALDPDVSYGRQPDGTGDWLYFYTSTPSEPNIGTGLTTLLVSPTFSHDSGLFTESFNLTISNTTPNATIVYTLDGSEPDINNVSGTSYNYKNTYPYSVGSQPGPLLTHTYTSNVYTSPITIVDRSPLPNKYTNINTRQHPIFTPPQPVRKGTIVKAKIFVNGVGSKTVAKNYFVWPLGNPFDIPIISLQIQENYLFDYEDGIYTAGIDFDTWRAANPTNNQAFRPEWNNYWRSGRDWEYPMHVEVFEPNSSSSILNMNGGFRIHGNNSRARAIKNLRWYARAEYDQNDLFDINVFDEPIYDATVPNNTEFDKILMRGDGTGGPVYFDVVFNKAMQPVFPSGITRIKPAIHFINGEYWGVTALRDRMDKDHYALNYGLNADNIVMIGCSATNCDLDEGDDTDYDSYIDMRDFMIDNDLSDDALFAQAEALLDMDSYINHIVMQLFTADSSYERTFWKVRVPENDNFGDGRWRLNTQDFEAAMDINTNWLAYHANTTDGADNGKIFGNLLANDSFKRRFLNRYADLLNTALLTSRFHEITNNVYDEVSPYLVEDANRYPRANFYKNSEKQELLDWGVTQPTNERNQLLNYFELAGTYNITLNVSDDAAGFIKVNTVDIVESSAGVDANPYPWTGIYFDQVPITLTANALPGYVFLNWSGDVNSTEPTITIDASENTQVQANFMPLDEEVDNVIYFWLIDNNIANDTPLENIEATYEATTLLSAQINYTSCLTGYPFNNLDPNWRKASMERRNRPTPINYRPVANNDIPFENASMRGIQIKQPFQSGEQQNILNFQLITYGYYDIKMSFAADSDGAAGSLIVEYWNGQAWTADGSAATNLDLALDYQLYEIDFSAVELANNNPVFQIRIRFQGENMTLEEGKRVHFNTAYF